mmetsp:Transcript_102096/g.255836  ORF Transcript_102096/g.255836 Transcript_102096/m.255836 type:complete len:351 (+) Transcript_102096:804-1856(+)
MRLRLRARYRSHWRAAFSSSGKRSSSTSFSSPSSSAVPASSFASLPSASPARSSLPSFSEPVGGDPVAPGEPTNGDGAVAGEPVGGDAKAESLTPRYDEAPGRDVSFASRTLVCWLTASPSSLEAASGSCSSPPALREPSTPAPLAVPLPWPSARLPPSGPRGPLLGEDPRGPASDRDFQGARKKGKPKPAGRMAGRSSPSMSLPAFLGSLEPSRDPLPPPPSSEPPPRTSSAWVPSVGTTSASAPPAAVLRPSGAETSPAGGVGADRAPDAIGRVRLCALFSRLLDRRRKLGQAEDSFSRARLRPPSLDADRSPDGGCGNGPVAEPVRVESTSFSSGSREPSRLRSCSP